MKRFATFPKVKTDVHAGVFFAEKFRNVLEISDDGEILILHELDSGKSPPVLTFTGTITERKIDGTFYANLRNPDTGARVGLTGLLRGDELICHISSMIDASFESDLYVKI